MPRPKSAPGRAGRKSVWGPRSSVSIKFPVAHRERYEQEAAEAGISLNEYVIRLLAVRHGLVDAASLEAGEGGEQLALGA